ncbi:hypothetical protein FKW77_007309 [Venturia effusa]|uniref:BTB domain-containing protein n=1 Tax=Venturia effusa TaxID=50376 RepID=A0A517L1J7_9PEZI|nr:hypothetical protein FKW77_007309 [Venturia effusa]
MAQQKNQEHLLASIAGLRTNDEYADVTITCKGTAVHVHKATICPQSLFFRNACKKDSFMEGKTGVIDLPEDEPLAVQALLDFLYTANYVEDQDALLHAQVYTLAEKYGLETLRTLALYKLQTDFEYIYRVLIPSFARAVKWIYDNTGENDQARKAIIVMTIQNLERVLWDKEGAFSIMMASLGDFSRDVARAVRCCAELRRGNRHFHARTSTLEDTGSKETCEKDDSSSKGESSVEPTSFTGYRCNHCLTSWRIDTTRIQDLPKEMELKCIRCPSFLTDTEKWDDESCILLYEMKCAACSVRFSCSNSAQSSLWTCFSCGSEGDFEQPEEF